MRPTHSKCTRTAKRMQNRTVNVVLIVASFIRSPGKPIHFSNIVKMPLTLYRSEMFVVARPEYRFDKSCASWSFFMGTNRMKRFIEQVSSFDGGVICRSDTKHRTRLQAFLVLRQWRKEGVGNSSGSEARYQNAWRHLNLMQ